jgi:hypothetical protein
VLLQELPVLLHRRRVGQREQRELLLVRRQEHERAADQAGAVEVGGQAARLAVRQHGSNEPSQPLGAVGPPAQASAGSSSSGQRERESGSHHGDGSNVAETRDASTARNAVNRADRPQAPHELEVRHPRRRDGAHELEPRSSLTPSNSRSPPAERGGHETDLHLVDESRAEVLPPGLRSACQRHVHASGGPARRFQRRLDALGDERERGCRPRAPAVRARDA